MRYWYKYKGEINTFLQSIVEKRIVELVYAFSEEDSDECDNELNFALENIVDEAILEANNRPEDLLAIQNGIQIAYTKLLSNLHEETELKKSSIDSFVKDTSFKIMQNAYQRLFHKYLNIPTDVRLRLKQRQANLKTTGNPGIDPTEMFPINKKYNQNR